MTDKEEEKIIEGYLREYLESKGFKLSKSDYMWGVGWLLPIKSKGELTNEYIKYFNEMREKGVWKKKDSKWWNLDNLFKGRFDYNFSVEGKITIDKRGFYSWLKKKASGGEKEVLRNGDNGLKSRKTDQTQTDSKPPELFICQVINKECPKADTWQYGDCKSCKEKPPEPKKPFIDVKEYYPEDEPREISCPKCVNEKMVIVNFLYNRSTTEIIPNAGKRLMCLYCGLQSEICRECGKTEDEVKLKTEMDNNTYLCTECMTK